MPQYQRAVEKTRATEAILTISNLEKALSLYRLEHGLPARGAFVSFLGEDPSGELDIDLSCETVKDSNCFTKNFRYSALPIA